MSVLHKIITLSLVLLCLGACSDDGSGDIVRRIDEDGNAFSPASLQGSIEYLPSMNAEMVRVVRLDDKLNPIDSFEIPTEKTYGSDIFATELLDFEYPYVKIVTVFEAENKKTMEFAQYVHFSGDNTRLKQNIFAALAADRIEYLVKKKKKSFDEAEKQAFEELGAVFGMNLEGVDGRNYKGLGTGRYEGDRLEDLIPYVFCRHEISDSLFYSDVKKFRDGFAKKGTLDSAWIIRAADTWLSTFEILVDSADYLFKSKSRDTVNGLGWLDEIFFGRAYGMGFEVAAGAQNKVQIKNKASLFYGRSFIIEYHRKYGLLTNRWRLQSVLEDSLGSCIYDQYDVIYGGTRSIQRNDTIYTCRGESHIWEVITDRDSLFNREYGECSRNKNNGQPIYVRDSLFVCECEGSKCAWSDKYVNRVFLESDTMYAKVLDAKATVQFGKCTYKNSGDMQKLDSLYVECSDNRWNPLDSLLYYLGHCSSVNYKARHNGSYYSCLGKWPDIDDTTWREVSPPEYYNDDCDLDRIVEYDSSYYICEQLECEGDGCFAFRTWRKLEDAELIPSALNTDSLSPPEI